MLVITNNWRLMHLSIGYTSSKNNTIDYRNGFIADISSITDSAYYKDLRLGSVCSSNPSLAKTKIIFADYPNFIFCDYRYSYYELFSALKKTKIVADTEEDLYRSLKKSYPSEYVIITDFNIDGYLLGEKYRESKYTCEAHILSLNTNNLDVSLLRQLRELTISQLNLE